MIAYRRKFEIQYLVTVDTVKLRIPSITWLTVTNDPAGLHFFSCTYDTIKGRKEKIFSLPEFLAVSIVRLQVLSWTVSLVTSTTVLLSVLSFTWSTGTTDTSWRRDALLQHGGKNPDLQYSDLASRRVLYNWKIFSFKGNKVKLKIWSESKSLVLSIGWSVSLYGK